MTYLFSAKVDFLFGQGAAEQTGQQLAGLGCRKVFCLYDKGVKQAGIVDPIIANIKAAGIEVVEYDGVLADPPDTMVNECGEIGRQAQVDGIVGIGGGSTMDTAKAVNVLLSNPGKIQEYFMGGKLPSPESKPLILLPTTSGTASEVTYVSVITNTEKELKDGLNGPATTANLAIIDPLLTKGMPPAITASTGMDTLAHALEAYTAIQANPMSDILAEKAIELTIEYLPRAYKDGNDMEAREKMSFACMLAGEAFNNALVHFGHAFGQGFGAAHHIPHGIGCAIGQPAVIAIAAELTPQKVHNIAKLFGMDLSPDISDKELGEVVGKKVKEFGKQIGIPSMAELGIKESDLENIAKKTMDDGVFMMVPKKMSYEDVLSTIQSLYADD